MTLGSFAAAVVPLVPGVVAATAVGLAVAGFRLLRTPAVEGLEVDDLVLIRAGGGAAAREGLLGRSASRLVPAMRRLLGPTGSVWLRRQVRLAGGGPAVSEERVLQQAATWLIIVAPALLLFVLQGRWLMVPLCLVVVPLLPLAQLSRRRRLRQERLDRDLPDFLDILSVTVAAGVAFRPALARVAERFGGPLAEEISLTLGQIANGSPRRAAFSALRDRNASEALAQFVTAFLQSEELGAPLAETLGQIALDMRRAGAQRLRQKAARAVPQVTLVTTTLLVPGAIILIAVGMYIGSDVDFGSLFGTGS
jgi:tight adherence protein C